MGSKHSEPALFCGPFTKTKADSERTVSNSVAVNEVLIRAGEEKNLVIWGGLTGGCLFTQMHLLTTEYHCSGPLPSLSPGLSFYCYTTLVWNQACAHTCTSQYNGGNILKCASLQIHGSRIIEISQYQALQSPSQILMHIPLTWRSC